MDDFIKSEIEKNKSSKTSEFTSKLTPTKYEILGVRIPILRDIAKRFCKHYKNKTLIYLQNPLTSNFEEIMIYGMIIGNLTINNHNNTPKSPQDRISIDLCDLEDMIITFVKYIDNWAVCDIFSGGLKKFAKSKGAFEFTLKFLNKDDEFEVRFGVVMLLSHFINEKYIDRILEVAPNVKHKGYYVKMALAWLISICYIKFSNKTIIVLQNNLLDKWTHNKAISKINDSRRVSDEDKIMLKNMRIK